MELWETEVITINGDLSYAIKRGEINKHYVDIEIVAYSDRWDNFDAVIEFREKEGAEWRSDMQVLFSTANSLDKNRLRDLSCSSTGGLNLVRWEYPKNTLKYGQKPDIRLNILPRYLNFSTSQLSTVVSENSGINTAKFVDSATRYSPININQSKQFIAVTDNSVRVYNNFSSSFIYEYGGLLNPSFAIQINNGNYLVADTGNDEVIEISEDLSTLIDTISVTSPVFLDYLEETDTLLVTDSGGTIYEYVRGSFILVWTSSTLFNDLTTATYSKKDPKRIVTSDIGDNKIRIIDRGTGLVSIYSGFSGFNGETDVFVQPYVATELADGMISVVEKVGRSVTFEDFVSSSSSSIDSSSTSSMTSSSLSSSSSSEGYTSDSSSTSEGYSESSSSGGKSESSSSEGYSESSSSSSEGYSESSSSSSEGYSESSSSSEGFSESSSSSEGYSESSSTSSEGYSESSSTSSEGYSESSSTSSEGYSESSSSSENYSESSSSEGYSESSSSSSSEGYSESSSSSEKYSESSSSSEKYSESSSSSADNECFELMSKRTSPNPELLGFFGHDVSISGNRAIVGAYAENSDAGRVYYYEFDGSTWDLQQTISIGTAFEHFGQYLSIDGDRMIIGTNNTASYVYYFSGGTWSLQQTISIANSQDVSISGDVLVICVPASSINFYNFNGSSWVSQQVIVSANGLVSMSGNKTIIGIPDIFGPSNGTVNIYNWTGATWILEQNLTSPSPTPGGDFGISVDIIEDKAIVGASGEQVSGTISGRAHIYELTGVNWNLVGSFGSPNFEDGGLFGSSVSISNDQAIIGARSEDPTGGGSPQLRGTVYAYNNFSGTWILQEELVSGESGEQWYGGAVDMSEDNIIVGAAATSLGGKVYMYECQGAREHSSSSTSSEGYSESSSSEMYSESSSSSSSGV